MSVWSIISRSIWLFFYGDVAKIYTVHIHTHTEFYMYIYKHMKYIFQICIYTDIYSYSVCVCVYTHIFNSIQPPSGYTRCVQKLCESAYEQHTNYDFSYFSSLCCNDKSLVYHLPATDNTAAEEMSTWVHYQRGFYSGKTQPQETINISCQRRRRIHNISMDFATMMLRQCKIWTNAIKTYQILCCLAQERWWRWLLCGMQTCT